MDELRVQMTEIKNKLDELQKITGKINDFERMLKESIDHKKLFQEKLVENIQETKKWWDLFSKKVQTLVTDVDKLQINVNDTKEKMENSDDKRKRRNNVVIYNLPEN